MTVIALSILISLKYFFIRYTFSYEKDNEDIIIKTSLSCDTLKRYINSSISLMSFKYFDVTVSEIFPLGNFSLLSLLMILMINRLSFSFFEFRIHCVFKTANNLEIMFSLTLTDDVY